MRVLVIDDVLAARGERFAIPGLEVAVHPHADDCAALLSARPDMVCMDFAMGPAHLDGAQAIRALRAGGFAGRIVAMSSDPAANARMLSAGADEALEKKAMLRSFLVDLGARR
jgi:CheY-like chemotaxis protein